MTSVKRPSSNFKEVFARTNENNDYFRVAQQLRKRRALLEKKNFCMDVQMKADGEKIYKINLSRPKMVMRPDILLMIFEFFTTAFPLYSKQSKDHPNNYNWDPNAARRQELLLELKEGLVIFENSRNARQTVVC